MRSSVSRPWPPAYGGRHSSSFVASTIAPADLQPSARSFARPPTVRSLPRPTVTPRRASDSDDCIVSTPRRIDGFRCHPRRAVCYSNADAHTGFQPRRADDIRAGDWRQRGRLHRLQRCPASTAALPRCRPDHDGAQTTANFFDVMGVQPILGRLYTVEEERQATTPSYCFRTACGSDVSEVLPPRSGRR